MLTFPHLGLFFILVLGVVLLPGLDMAFVMGSALAGGRQRGLAAVAGIIAGGVFHVVMTVLGISVLLQMVPGAFNALLLAGSIYLGWIGISLMGSASAFSLPEAPDARSTLATFRQGLLTNLLNPKAYLFMLAVFPQFLRPQAGAVWAQSGLLWVIIALNQLVVYGALALMAARARPWLQGRPTVGLWAARSVGVALIGGAVLTLVKGWHGA